MIRKIRLAATAAAFLLSAAACGQDSAAPPVASPAATPPATPAVISIPLADLRASVPDFQGWTRGEITGEAGTSVDQGPHVVATFSRGRETLELEIADTGGAARAVESLEHLAGSTTSRTVANGYFKGTTIGGFPAVESWNTVEKLGEVSVLVRRRYIIHVAGAGLADAGPMRALAEAVDTSRLR